MVKVFGFSLLAFDLVIMSQFGVEQFIESWLDSVKRKKKYHQQQPKRPYWSCKQQEEVKTSLWDKNLWNLILQRELTQMVAKMV